MFPIPILYIGQDIGWYLVFCLLTNNMGKSFARIICRKNGWYLKYCMINRLISGNKLPEISLDEKLIYCTTVYKCTLFFYSFACILHHFYLVNDIYDTKPPFSYQYFITQYQIWTPDMHAYPRYLPWYPISDMKPPIRFDPDIWYLEPCFQPLKHPV